MCMNFDNGNREVALRLEAVMADVKLARDTKGQPGGKANLMAAEIAAGRFVAEHGAKVLGMLMDRSVSAGGRA